MSRFTFPVDPAELASRTVDPSLSPEEILIAREERRECDESDAEELARLRDEIAAIDRADLARMLDFVPPIEADILQIHIQGATQYAIAKLFGMTQSAVSYRLERVLKRLRFLRNSDYLSFERDDMFYDLYDLLGRRRATIMVGMYECGSQSEVAAHLELSQGHVRHQFMLGLERLKKGGPRYGRYRKLFELLHAGKGVLHENRTWEHRRKAQGIKRREDLH